LLQPGNHGQAFFGSAPLCARCLLFLSGSQLLGLLVQLFFIHLLLEGSMQAWIKSLGTVLTADVLCVGLFNISAFIFTTSLVLFMQEFKVDDFWAILRRLLWLLFPATLAWHAMVRICAFHGLRALCLAPEVCPRNKGAPDLSGLLQGFVLLWTWVPTGFLLVVAGAMWRPWYFLTCGVPLALFRKGPFVAWDAWWQWREALVGSVCWLCVGLVALAARSRAFAIASEGDRRFMLAVGAAISLFCTSLVFYLTTEPIVSFWLFLLRPWVVLGRAAVRSEAPGLSVEEWVACVVMLWAWGRGLYIATSARLEQWNARKRMEETLRLALAHPFRAELEQGFGRLRRSVSGDLGDGGDAAVARAAWVDKEEPLAGSLSSKRKALINDRRQWLLNKSAGAASLPGHLSLTVRRERLLEETWSVLFDRLVSELLAPRISVTFEGEKGFDAGGLTRDWFDSVGRALAEHANEMRGTGLLTTAPDQTLLPRPVGQDHGDVPTEEQEKYRELLSLGRFMALAVFHEHPLPLSFSLILCKHLLCVPVGMDDVRQLDPEFYRGRVEQVLKDGGLDETVAALGEPLTFVSAPTELRQAPEDLKPGGASIAVTESNKTEYVQLLCEDHLCGGIRREIQCLLQGFWDVLPLEAMRRCQVGPRELSVLISGVADLDPDEWRQHSNNRGGSQVHDWFWEFVRELNLEERCMLLHFATGSSRLPPGGFAELQPSFTVAVSDSGSSSHLPHAHTCVNQIVLPRYISQEQMRKKLLQAISTEEFDFV